MAEMALMVQFQKLSTKVGLLIDIVDAVGNFKVSMIVKYLSL